jgi:hypothetical protein
MSKISVKEIEENYLKCRKAAKAGINNQCGGGAAGLAKTESGVKLRRNGAAKAAKTQLSGHRAVMYRYQ